MIDYIFEVLGFGSFVILWACFTSIACLLCFVWGYVRGDDLAWGSKCELCQGKTDLDKAYENYGRAELHKEDKPDGE